VTLGGAAVTRLLPTLPARGFEQGGAALVGALSGPEPVARALALAIEGGADAAQAARRARDAVERLDTSSK